MIHSNLFLMLIDVLRPQFSSAGRMLLNIHTYLVEIKQTVACLRSEVSQVSFIVFLWLIRFRLVHRDLANVTAATPETGLLLPASAPSAYLHLIWKAKHHGTDSSLWVWQCFQEPDVPHHLYFLSSFLFFFLKFILYIYYY